MTTLQTYERRVNPRMAGAGLAEVQVLDRLGRTVATLSDATVLDVSAGGLAICSVTGVSEDMAMRVRPVGHDASFEMRVLSNLPMPSDPGRFKLRCKLTVGQIPAALVKTLT